jgi:hypothetical protein
MQIRIPNLKTVKMEGCSAVEFIYFAAVFALYCLSCLIGVCYLFIISMLLTLHSQKLFSHVYFINIHQNVFQIRDVDLN